MNHLFPLSTFRRKLSHDVEWLGDQTRKTLRTLFLKEKQSDDEKQNSSREQCDERVDIRQKNLKGKNIEKNDLLTKFIMTPCIQPN